MRESRDVNCFPEDVPDATNKIDENNENRRNKNNSQWTVHLTSIGRKEYLVQCYQLNASLEQELTDQMQAYKRRMLLIGDLWG